MIDFITWRVVDQKLVEYYSWKLFLSFLICKNHIDCNSTLKLIFSWDDIEGCEPNWTWEPWMTDDDFEKSS